MKIIVRPQQAGKTSALIDWVLEGVPTDSYPGWSRVLLVHSMSEADRLRGRGGSDAHLDYRQVFYYEEWQKARLGHAVVGIAIDNVDTWLQYMTGYHSIGFISINGDPDVDLV